MLHSGVAMRHIFSGFICLCLIFVTTTRGAAQETDIPPGIILSTPKSGEAVQGQVTITGTTAVEGFASANLFFGHMNDPTQTWFLIAEDLPQVEEAALTEWNTFAITDGNYNLRLVVNLIDGSQQTATTEGVRVRNYSAIETLTPTDIPSPTLTATLAPGEITPSPTPQPIQPPLIPTLTPLPPNPAQIPPSGITDSLLRGAAGTLAIFILIGLYTSIRRR